MSFLHRHRGLTPYLLLLPGLAWLALFFLAPLGFLGYQSLAVGHVRHRVLVRLGVLELLGRDLDLPRAVHPLVPLRRDRDAAGDRDRLSARLLDRLSCGTLEERLPDPDRRPAVRHLPRADAGLAQHPLG